MASGRALDALCALSGTYRKQAAPSRAVIQATLAASVEVIADESGPTYVDAGKLTKILTPHAALTCINNPEDALPGRSVEADVDLRLRRIKELGAPGSSTEGAMTARLLKVKGVEAVHVKEPIGGLKEHGWQEGDVPTASNFNWLFYELGYDLEQKAVDLEQIHTELNGLTKQVSALQQITQQLSETLATVKMATEIPSTLGIISVLSLHAFAFKMARLANDSVLIPA